MRFEASERGDRTVETIVSAMMIAVAAECRSEHNIAKAQRRSRLVQVREEEQRGSVSLSRELGTRPRLEQAEYRSVQKRQTTNNRCDEEED
jgi:Flp pilus assembly protein TadB